MSREAVGCGGGLVPPTPALKEQHRDYQTAYLLTSPCKPFFRLTPYQPTPEAGKVAQNRFWCEIRGDLRGEGLFSGKDTAPEEGFPSPGVWKRWLRKVGVWIVGDFQRGGGGR